MNIFNSYISRNAKFCSQDCAHKSGISRLGKKHSEDTIKKLSILSKNNPKVMATIFQPNHTLWNHPNVKKNWIEKGTKPPNWLGGERAPSEVIKDDPRYATWRKAVFERDNYTCVLCGARGGKNNPVILNADHIKEKCNYPELVFDVSNGRTLCVDCHRKTDNYGTRAKKI